MTDRDAIPEEWLVESDLRPADWDWEDSDQGWHWADDPSQQPAQSAAPPWYRGPKLLLPLIGLAAAALVVSTALLVGGRFSGEIPTSRQLDNRTATATPRTSAPAAAEPRPVTTTPPPESPTSSAEPVPGLQQLPEPAPPPAPPAPPAAPAPKRSEGPRINVTRTPMSFTPSISPGR